MIDTHSHIQFRIFDKDRDHVIEDARKIGITKIIAVGTNLKTSKNAVEISERYPEVFASVGIHPHHIFGIMNNASGIMEKLENLITSPKVVAIGETGMDKHVYKSTKYKSYLISNKFIELQKVFFAEQIKLAIKFKKSLIIHNREAVEETLEVLRENWGQFLEGRSVFHFCEPDKRLLDFAAAHHIFIGVDGDILTDKTKQEFVKDIPLELLVLETDSPFISKEPKGLLKILEFISRLLKKDIQKMEESTLKNSLSLFKL